jgi:SAM-dependent methyltransferase
MISSSHPENRRRSDGYEDAFVAEYYDATWIVRERADLEFYVGCAAAYGSPALELGCGTGRILLRVAEAGHRVCGLDLSPYMLARCREKLSHLPAEVQQRVRLVAGDMTSFDLNESFSLILIPFRPFQHLLAVEDQLACLANAKRHLAPGGRLVFDLFQTDARRMHDPFFLAERPLPGEVALPDGRVVRVGERTIAFHRAIQCNDVELIYYVTHPGGRVERLANPFRIRYFFHYEVEHLLARAGFRVSELFGDFTRAPLRDDSPDMIFVAERLTRLVD